MINESIIIRKAWRSELPSLVLFGLSAVAAPVLSAWFPSSIIRGELLTIGTTRLLLDLPLYWLLPVAALLRAIFRVYNVAYVICPEFIESREGILSLRQSITRIRYEDIKSIETDQSVLDRILDVGLVEMATAATGEVEVAMKGVERPKAIQDLVQEERDRKQRQLGARAARDGSRAYNE